MHINKRYIADEHGNPKEVVVFIGGPQKDRRTLRVGSG
jgi:hypothetical protein